MGPPAALSDRGRRGQAQRGRHDERRKVVCTAFPVKAKDGSVIVGRTMEFGLDLKSNIIVVPRGRDNVGTGPRGLPGLRWRSRYGFVGCNAFGSELVADGLNEVGLAMSELWLPGHSSFLDASEADAERALGPAEFANWSLGSFATVTDLKAALPSVKVWGAKTAELGDIPAPVHFAFHDPGGDCLVVEFVGGQVDVYDNPLGVLTNAPPFDWHVNNVRNYINLTALNVPKVELSGIEIAATGQGTGMLGLPGDYTPPSRFVRAVAFSQAAEQPDHAAEAINTAWHIINTFDIFRGAVVARNSDGEASYDITQWATVRDLTNRRMYLRTYESMRILMVDLARIDFGGAEVKTLVLDRPEAFEDVTEQMV
jgi:choloylglycine hydrolase